MNTFLTRFWTIFYTTSEAFCKTPLGETGCLGNPYFIHWLPKHPVFWYSQLGYLWLPSPHCAAPVWLTGHYATPLVTRCFPPQPLPREAEDFPRGDMHFKHVPPLNIPNLLITKRVIYGRSNLNLIAAQIPEESAPHEIWTLFTDR